MIYRIAASLTLALALTYATANPALATGPDKPTQKCSAYTWAATGSSVCNEFPGTGDVDCADLKKPVNLVGQWDPWNLDRDHDGKGCDKPTPTGSASTPTTPATTKPTTAPTTTPTTAPTTAASQDTATANPTISETPAATGPQLPLTGPPVWAFAGAGVLLVALGGLAVFARRRRTRFTA